MASKILGWYFHLESRNISSTPMMEAAGLSETFLIIRLYSITFGDRGGTVHCATNRKVAGSIPDGVIGIFH